MVDAPKKVQAILAQSHDLPVTEIVGFFHANGRSLDRRWEVRGRDQLLYIHWFPGKTSRSVGSVRLTHYDGHTPRRITSKQLDDALTALRAERQP